MVQNMLITYLRSLGEFGKGQIKMKNIIKKGEKIYMVNIHIYTKNWFFFCFDCFGFSFRF